MQTVNALVAAAVFRYSSLGVMVQRIVPDLGVGAGLRVPHYRTVIEQHPAIDFFEIISENFMVEGGKPRFHLEQVLDHYALIQHGVSLGIGSPGELDWAYLKRLKALTQKVKPAWLSDHFCWTRAGGVDLHDLLPLPYTLEVAKRVAERARAVQDYLELPFALENTSSYLAYRASTMSEWDFINEVCERANIGLMFDVNNVYVAAYNHGFDAYQFVRNVPHERILQIHIAGHTHRGKYLLDTHNGNISAPVWDLYRATIELAGAVSTLVEWDDEVPEFSELATLVATAKAVRSEALAVREARTHGATASFVEGRSLVPSLSNYPLPPAAANSTAPLRAAPNPVDSIPVGQRSSAVHSTAQGGPRSRALEEPAQIRAATAE